MSADSIRYDILVQEALRGMVRDLLADAARKGLPGEHHFFITFDTTFEGVRMSPRLREQYPEEMTVVLQYQFRDLKVTDKAFEVVLSFGGVPERLHIPLDAINSFTDPSVQFALQFEALALPPDQDNVEAEAGATEPGNETSKETPKEMPKELSRQPKAKPRTSVPASPRSSPAAGAEAKSDQSPEPPGDKPGAEVVRLDRFRKK
jgi:hypothetical protein